MPRKRHQRERKSLRLKGWDYRTPVWYFVTMVTKDRRHFFGKIRDGIIGLSTTGSIACQNWQAIPDHFDHVKLNQWIVMPNHVHGLVGIIEWPNNNKNQSGQEDWGQKEMRSKKMWGREISRPHRNKPQRNNSHRNSYRNNTDPQESDAGSKFGPLKSRSLSSIIQSYKASVTRWARKNENYQFAWQSRFYDHIVRNDRELDRIRNYIIDNPLRWDEDLFSV